VAKAGRAPVYEDVMIRLAGLVKQGRLKPGDRLPSERILSERMGVSRATLREALRVMQLQGLTVSRRGAGNFIASGNAQNLTLALHHLALQDIFQLRLLIEPSIAALAAERATAKDVARLQSVLRLQEQELRQKKSIAGTDETFHSALAESTHNRAVLQIGATLMKVIAPTRNESLQTSERARLSLFSHRRIVNAVKARDSVEARKAMEEHIRSIDAELFGLSVVLFSSTPDTQEIQTVGGIH